MEESFIINKFTRDQFNFHYFNNYINKINNKNIFKIVTRQVGKKDTFFF